MRLLRVLTGCLVACTLVVGSVRPTIAQGKGGLEFTKLWTHGHTTEGQLSEIPAFDPKTRTIWVVGVVGVDVLDLATGALIEHIDVTPHGAVNSVAIFNGLAAFAVEAASQSAACPSCDRRTPGKVLLYDTRTRELTGGVAEIQVGSLPDMLTFTPDGSRLLVVNEGTPNVKADDPYAAVDPTGSVTIIDMQTRTVVATAVPPSLGTSGTFLRLATATGMDVEPEYIAVNHEGTKAFVTLQEANGLGVLDLESYEFTDVIGLGAKDFNVTGNEIDPKHNDGVVTFQKVAAKGLYMPDSIATYKSSGTTYLVMANEGDFREDNVDRVAAGAAAPLDTLRVVKDLKDAGTGLFAAGARSFSIRTTDGTIVYDSKSILDREAHALGLYDDGRSRDKGVEPEGVALLEVGSRTFAFIGLERTLKSAVAVFDITNPASAAFLQLIVTDGDLGPEGLTTFASQGQAYLAIANEVVAAGETTSNTTLYRVDTVK